MADGRPKLLATFILIFSLTTQCHGAQQYLGKFLGKLSELHHGVSGEIYAVDARTLHIKDFTYDGEGPAAYFWAGSTRTPGSSGFRVRDENGSGAVLKRYRKKSITLTLPDGKNLNNIKWFSVWCEEFAVNFGDVKIPRNFDYPKPQKIEALHGVHGISSDNVVIVDAQTLLVPNLSYDGEAPDAKFWAGRGAKPSPQGIRIPDENGKEIPLRRYDRKTVVLTLPGDLTVFDIGHFGIWCEAFTVDFGHVRIPQPLNIPPSLKMLGVSPQSKLNCEVLFDELAFEVRWAVAGDSIVLQLVSKLDNGEYMSFGLSGDDTKTQMIGGDVVVAWVDKETLKGYANDYYLEDKSQCSGPRGSCPDERISENTNSIRLLNAAMVNGYSIVTYQRPLKPSDYLDRPILTNQSQPIIWAIGPLNQRKEVSFHSHFTKHDHFIDFGRPAKWNCPMPEADSTTKATTTETLQYQTVTQRRRRPEIIDEKEEGEQTYPVEVTTKARRRGGNRENERTRQEERPTTSRRRGGGNGRQPTTTDRPTRTVKTPKPVSTKNAWHIPAIQCYEPDDGVFYAQMGPTGGKRGYPAITGHVGWGISWYINGLLIPEINVIRGKTYTFVVEGGADPSVPAKYHPFYITDDPVGGYEYKTPEERQNIRIFAGAKQTRDGEVYPTGTGRLCHWTHTGDSEADEFQSFGAFQRTLQLRCDEGEPGVITWTPDANTPDTVYYQCFTHRYLGWKINVLDSCDIQQPQASELEPVLVAAPAPATNDGQDLNVDNGDLQSASSINVETRLKPNDLFQTQTKQLADKLEKTTSTTKTTILDNSYQPSTYNMRPINADIITVQPDYEPPKVVEETDLFPPPPPPPPASGGIFPNRKPMYEINKIPLRIIQNRTPLVIKPVRRPIPVTRPYKKSYYRIPLVKRPIPLIRQKLRPKPSNQLLNQTNLNLNQNQNQNSSTMHPAVNTGFHPESVVIEGGFKPIITEQLEERMSEDESELDEDVGVIKATGDENQQYIESFEPMFIPSPPDSHLYKKQNSTKQKRPVMKKNTPVMYIVKHVPRNVDPQQEDEITAEAAERVEAYYLPPDNRKTKPVDHIRKPTDLDIPPGALITFDGKTVSGTSLTAPISEPGTFVTPTSKASELLRLSPQYGPFRGEIPSLDPNVLNVAANLPQITPPAVLNRDLNAPAPVPASGSGHTKLNRIRYHRSKREPHHTPEHTAEQERQKLNGNSSAYLINSSLLFVIVLNLLIKFC